MTSPPRILSLELCADSLCSSTGSSGELLPSRDELARRLFPWGGVAAGLAALLDRAARGRPAPFVVAVGDAVRRGLPTAARASVLTRAPLTGRLGLGQVGGELGPRLAAVADTLILEGRTELSGAVLCVGRDAVCRLQSFPDLVGLAPALASRLLEERLGPCGLLVVGPGAERGLAFASLASEGERPSFVGRGGLGSAFAALGLKALAVLPEPTPLESSARTRRLLAAIGRSPRLAARADGGTFELLHAHAARGELSASGDRSYEVGDAHRLIEETREQRVERKGCRGCPTPCGWVFERADGMRQQAHFGAAEALGTRLGLPALDDALMLLARCDQLGIDAKEAGAVLGVLEELRRAGNERAREAPRGTQRERAERDLQDLVSAQGEPWESLRLGAARARAVHGLESAAATKGLARGEASGVEQGLANVLARAVSTGGVDPMRSFPFLIETGEAELVEDLFGAALPAAALDPQAPTAKGRLVWWHENLMAAIDLTGFCAFSSAGLLSDGCAELDELASWILPDSLTEPTQAGWRALAPGKRLLAVGATLVVARHELDQRYRGGTTQRLEPGADALGLAGMLDEYRAWRGLDVGGAPLAATLAACGGPGMARPRTAALESAQGTAAGEARAASREESNTGQRRPGPAVPAAKGRLELRASGALGEALARVGACEVELLLPASVDEAFANIVRVHASLEPHLFHRGRPLPAVWCRGRRLRAHDRVAAGDVLDLVTAIAGG